MIPIVLVIGGVALIARGATRAGTPIGILAGTLFIVAGLAVMTIEPLIQGVVQ